jgi:hypothetical protein
LVDTALGRKVLAEIEQREGVPLNDLSPARAYYYKNLLAELAQDMVKQTVAYNREVGRDLLQQWRREPLQTVSTITLPLPLTSWKKWATVAYLISGMIVVGYFTFALMRNPSMDSSVTVLVGFFYVTISPETRLFLVAMSTGALGSFIRSATFIYDYLGLGRLTTNLVWPLLLQPFFGMSLALVTYFILRGGILSTPASAQDVNLFSVAATSALAGMFSQSATTKLVEVADTIFRTNTRVSEQVDNLSGSRSNRLEK